MARLGWPLSTALALFAGAPALASTLYAGSYTGGTSKGIYAWRFDDRSGRLAPLGLMAATAQPAHIWIAPDGATLYAVNWEKEGGVSAFRIDRRTGALAAIDRVSAHGAQPNQVMLDPSGRIAVSVTYNSGTVAAFAVRPDGGLDEAFYVDQHAGSAVPRAHGIAFSPDGRRLYIADLGLDRIYVYRVDAAARRIEPATVPFVALHAGAGPRRLQVSRDGRFLYANHETDGEVSVLAIDGDGLREIQTIGTLPAGFAGKNMTAEIVLTADGRFLYVSNRGDDSIAMFAVNRADGRLTALGHAPAGGRTPRNLRLDPGGRFLLVANESGGNIVVMRIDRRTGALAPTGFSAAIDTPGGMFFEGSE